MIVVRLVGGLGNQLFQYAAGRALALRLGVGLGLDTRFYAGKRRGQYALDAFAVRTDPLDGIALPPSDRALGGIIRRFEKTPFSVFREGNATFDPTVPALPDWTYLEGYFQSDRYFADHADTIRRDLAVLPPPTPPNADMAERIAGSCAVSVHVRRGDYVTNRKVAARLGALDPTYYRHAADYIAERLDPVFFLFSDDPDWAEANLRFDNPVVVVRQPDPAYEDLRLMAACRHHIIANSSFSWWGAWLNSLSDKIIVAPRMWFRDPAIDTSTIVPSGWVTL